MEFVKKLTEQGANILVTGRNLDALNETKKKFPDVHVFQSDVANPKDIEQLFKDVITQFPMLNIIINNAGIMSNVDLQNNTFTLENITQEIDINLSGTVRMVQQFLPHLAKQKSAAVINISSGMGFIPVAISPIYCATKAAVHIYTQSLRLQMKNTKVKVFEIAPPKTNKPMQTALSNEKSNVKMMKISTLVSIAIKGIINDTFEIRPGLSNTMKWMSRIAPDFFAALIDRNNEKAKI